MSPQTVLHAEDKHLAAEVGIKDIWLGAWLIALGYKLKWARSDAYNSEFYFADVVPQDIVAYYNGDERMISGKALLQGFQDLRRISRQVRLIPQPDDLGDE